MKYRYEYVCAVDKQLNKCSQIFEKIKRLSNSFQRGIKLKNHLP